VKRNVVLIIVKQGVVQSVQSTDAEALIIVRDEDAGGEIACWEWPETQWGDELDRALEELGEDVEE